VNGAGTQSTMMHAMAVEAQLKCAQARNAAQLRIHHCKQVIPVSEALASLVGMVSLDAPIEHGTRQPL
jgi:hypothetical protein